MIFDTHAHYTDTAFDEDRDALLASLFAGEVDAIINGATDVASSKDGIALAARYPHLYTTVGIHPEEAAGVTDEALSAIRALSFSPKVIAIGEIGLDYHYEDACPRAEQQAVFARQLALANERKLPVVVHDRDAHEDTLALLREYRPKGVIHCFSGSAESAAIAIKLGLSIGLGGVTTFKNARKTVEVAAMLPDDRLLLETDAPYLAPEPFRGRRNHSGYIRTVAERVAAIRGTTAEEICRISRENACRLFGVSL